MINKLNARFCIVKFKIFIIIIVFILFLLSCVDGRLYPFDDGMHPKFSSGSFEIRKIDNNSFVQFGPSTNNQIKAKLDEDAFVAFRWRHDLPEDLGKLVFLASNIEKPIEYHSKCGNSSWEKVQLDVPCGEIDWLLTNLSDIGYLDDLIIEYKGCNITEFDIYPADCELNDDKIIYIKLDNIDMVHSAQLELTMPQGINIYNYSTLGFFYGATLKHEKDILTIVQKNSMNVDSAEIKLWFNNVPHGRHSIQVIKLIVNDEYQHPSLFNCKWSLNSNDVCVSAVREDMNDLQEQFAMFR